MQIENRPELSALRDQIAELQKQLRTLEHERGLLHRLRDSNARARLESQLETALLELGALVFDLMWQSTTESPEVAAEEPPEEPPADDGTAGAAVPGQATAAVETRANPPRFATVQTTTRALEAAPREAAPVVAVTPDVLQNLKSRMRDGAPKPEVQVQLTTTVDAGARGVIEATLEVFGATPSHLQGKKPVARELERIHEVASTHMDTWEAAGTRVNRLLTGWLAARARAVQSEVQKKPIAGVEEELETLFRRLTQHSAVTQPGSVSGLARTHKPRTGSWLADALAIEHELRGLMGDLKYLGAQAGSTEAPSVNLDDELRRLTDEVRGGMDAQGFVARLRYLLSVGASAGDTRLVRLALPFAGDLEGQEFAAVRRAVNHLVERDEETETADDASHIPDDWPWLTHTRGKVAMIVGGEPRPERLVRLKSTFGFGELDWLQGIDKGGRSVDSLVQKMRNGTVDMVIVLRAFSSHKVSEKIFGVEEPQCVRVLADTYGVNQVRLAIERFCAVEPPVGRGGG